MNKYLLLFLPVIVLLFSCKQTAVDNGHLPAPLMKKILTDIQMAEVYSGMVKKDKAAAKNADSLSYYYKEILAHYKVSEKEFNSSMEWYRTHPSDLDTLYNSILPQFNKLEGIYNVR